MPVHLRRRLIDLHLVHAHKSTEVRVEPCRLHNRRQHRGTAVRENRHRVACCLQALQSWLHIRKPLQIIVLCQQRLFLPGFQLLPERGESIVERFACNHFKILVAFHCRQAKCELKLLLSPYLCNTQRIACNILFELLPDAYRVDQGAIHIKGERFHVSFPFRSLASPLPPLQIPACYALVLRSCSDHVDASQRRRTQPAYSLAQFWVEWPLWLGSIAVPLASFCRWRHRAHQDTARLRVGHHQLANMRLRVVKALERGAVNSIDEDPRLRRHLLALLHQRRRFHAHSARLYHQQVDRHRQHPCLYDISDQTYD